ncbi:uncharacterized protein [Rutidosis leptorrhynchoides]|uniref:uncharacterized protein n=1 Tax=Rutidosis leptorrhynchoides TaxID=125765 RepID=UPI003A996EAC
MEDTYKMLEFPDDDSDDEKIVSFINSLTEEEVDGEASSSRFPRSRVYIARDREDAAIRLYNDYFSETPMYPENKFKRRYRMSRQLFLRIVEGLNNDINVLNASPIFNSIKDGTAPPSPFDVNGRHYERGYYLGDGIYPDWAMLVKAPHNPIDQPSKKFKRFQESGRKDIERAFGVLQGRFAMLKTPARSKDFNKIRRHMYACIVLHNMIQENNGFAIGRREERMIERNPPRRLEHDLRDRDARVKEIRDKQVHQQLETDLTEHVWNLSPYFRSANNHE